MNTDLEIAEGIAPEPLMVGAEPYTSEAYAREEADKLWPKVWQHACRVEEIPNVGDYVTYDIMNDSILIVRSEPNKISGFYNVCAHRGRRLANGCGNTRQFICKFHAWRYNLKGELTYIVDEADWNGALDRERLRLPEVKIDTWGGWVWINMDPNCAPLREYLEPAASTLDPFELERMRYRWRMWCDFDCNWKVAMEAFMEVYHVAGSHPQLLKYAEFYSWTHAAGTHSHKGFKERKPKLNIAESNTYYRPGKGDDARVSIAKLQREIMDTVNAGTTQTLVDSAARLIDELPVGTPPDKVVAFWLESAQRDDAARGVIWPKIDPDHLAKAGNYWHVFPNQGIAYGLTFAVVYRARPRGYDPNKCIFDVAVIERFPEENEPKTEWVYAEPSDLNKWRSVLAQDFANMGEVQRGMRSRGFRGTRPNPKQEQTVTNFHRNLAKYMGTGAPRMFRG
jgi:phenylpropionate dioxygenase-like ring-hydroxylating dioxygenase large terminal subunit